MRVAKSSRDDPGGPDRNRAMTRVRVKKSSSLSLLLPDDEVEKEKDGMTRSWGVVPPGDPGLTAVSYGVEGSPDHDPGRTMLVRMVCSPCAQLVAVYLSD